MDHKLWFTIDLNQIAWVRFFPDKHRGEVWSAVCPSSPQPQPQPPSLHPHTLFLTTTPSQPQPNPNHPNPNPSHPHSTTIQLPQPPTTQPKPSIQPHVYTIHLPVEYTNPMYLSTHWLNRNYKSSSIGNNQVTCSSSFIWLKPKSSGIVTVASWKNKEKTLRYGKKKANVKLKHLR